MGGPAPPPPRVGARPTLVPVLLIGLVGGLGLFALVGTVATLATLSERSTQASQAEASRLLGELFRSWDAHALYGRMTEEYRTVGTEAEFAAFLARVRQKAGELQELGPPSGSGYWRYQKARGSFYEFGRYQVEGRFERQTADIQLDLARRRDGTWEVDGFQIRRKR